MLDNMTDVNADSSTAEGLSHNDFADLADLLSDENDTDQVDDGVKAEDSPASDDLVDSDDESQAPKSEEKKPDKVHPTEKRINKLLSEKKSALDELSKAREEILSLKKALELSSDYFSLKNRQYFSEEERQLAELKWQNKTREQKELLAQEIQRQKQQWEYDYKLREQEAQIAEEIDEAVSEYEISKLLLVEALEADIKANKNTAIKDLAKEIYEREAQRWAPKVLEKHKVRINAPKPLGSHGRVNGAAKLEDVEDIVKWLDANNLWDD